MATRAANRVDASIPTGNGNLPNKISIHMCNNPDASHHNALTHLSLQTESDWYSASPNTVATQRSTSGTVDIRNCNRTATTQNNLSRCHQHRLHTTKCNAHLHLKSKSANSLERFQHRENLTATVSLWNPEISSQLDPPIQTLFTQHPQKNIP